jgi:hypothetical protein
VDCDPDCNCNGIPDSCEGLDCNNNTIPDECEIPVGCGGLCTSSCDPDCNCNGTPDACETDCNGNTVPDDCDIAENTSDDCQPNGIPDECDITGGGGVLLDQNLEDGVVPPGWTATGTLQITNQCSATHATCGGSFWAYAGDTATCTYGDDELGELIAPPVLLGYGVSELRFCSRLDSEENWDFGRVLVNGTVAWEESGGSGEWEERVVDLGAFAGELATITFQFTSDAGVSGTLGWQVDNIYLFSESLDANGNGIPDDCECIPAVPSVDHPWNSGNNRYLSFLPCNAGNEVALLVTLTASNTFPGSVGQCWWVGEPGTGPASALEHATLECDPVYLDWTPYCDSDLAIHVGDDNIVPDSTYEIRAIASGCATDNPENYSAPLVISTSRWGDVVGYNPGDPPEGNVNFTDISAEVDGFVHLPTAASLWALNVNPETIQLCSDPALNCIDFVDIMCAVDAFCSLPYPFSAPPLLCTCP